MTLVLKDKIIEKTWQLDGRPVNLAGRVVRSAKVIPDGRYQATLEGVGRVIVHQRDVATTISGSSLPG